MAAFVHWQHAELGRENAAADIPDAEFPTSGYALVWNAWTQQLQGSNTPAQRKPRTRSGKSAPPAALPPPRAWHDATAEDVARFLQIRPGQRAHHQPQRQISEITRRRYWRLLDRIYAHALLQGWIASNPVQAVHPFERPAPEQPTGHVLPPALWAALPRYFPGSDDLQSARDQAVLRLLYDLALAPEEIRQLTMDALRNARQAPMDAGHNPCFVQIEGQRAAQQRCLALPSSTAAALAAWMEFRTRSGTPATAQAPLFESRKGGPLTIRALFHIASKTIALAQQASQAQSMPLARMGPQVMRNTAIVHWLHQGQAPTEVVQRIGVDHPRALAHLQHCVNAMAPVKYS
ncbi:MAG: site-specific integrase [Comamonas sp.]